MGINKRDHSATPRSLYDKTLIKALAIEWETRWELSSTLLSNKHDHIIQNTASDIFSTVIANERLYTGNMKMVLVDRKAYEMKYTEMVDKGNQMRLLLDTIRIFEPQVTYDKKEYLRLINDYNRFITNKVELREKNMNQYKFYPTEKVRVNTETFAEEQKDLNNILISIDTHKKIVNKILDLNHITIEH